MSATQRMFDLRARVLSSDMPRIEEFRELVQEYRRDRAQAVADKQRNTRSRQVDLDALFGPPGGAS